MILNSVSFRLQAFVKPTMYKIRINMQHVFRPLGTISAYYGPGNHQCILRTGEPSVHFTDRGTISSSYGPGNHQCILQTGEPSVHLTDRGTISAYYGPGNHQFILRTGEPSARGTFRDANCIRSPSATACLPCRETVLTYSSGRPQITGALAARPMHARLLY